MGSGEQRLSFVSAKQAGILELLELLELELELVLVVVAKAAMPFVTA
jgi:hypothetical protein